jgi:hypothetical protein
MLDDFQYMEFAMEFPDEIQDPEEDNGTTWRIQALVIDQQSWKYQIHDQNSAKSHIQLCPKTALLPFIHEYM